MDDDDYETLILSQRQELMAAQFVESDLDLAFSLQMQEAMAASLSLLPSSSSSSSSSPPRPPPPPSGNHESDFISLQTQELDQFRQVKQDAQLSQLEMNRIAADLHRRSHDESFALEIDQMPDVEWEKYGDNYERPFGKGQERPVRVRVYFNGMDSVEMVKGNTVKLAGVGVAVCDEKDRVVLKISKPVVWAENCREVMQAKALIEGLNAVVGMGAKIVDVFFDYRTLYNHVTGKWMVKQRKVTNLINQVLLLHRRFEACNFFLVPRCQIKYAFQLARDAIDSQVTKNTDLNGNNDVKETCSICLEDTEPSQMYAVDECLHRFCFSCMKQHVEVKLLHAILPSCPHEGCRIRLKVESCTKFLTPKLINIMSQRMREESIPVTQKIYCPYPKCSALMSVNEAIRPLVESLSKQPAHGTSGLRRCIECSGNFCIKCKVPWHERMSCYDYRRLNPQNQVEEWKLKNLARQKLWRQCVKCNHMIELAEGCFHMTCRCGYEFCYTCGAEWRDKKATCSCPLFEYDTDNDSDDYNDDEHDDYDEYSEEEDYGVYHDGIIFV